MVSEQKIFSCNSHYKPMADNDTPGVGPVWTPAARFAGFIKGTTINCYMQNMKVLGFVVLEKNIYYVFPCKSIGALLPWKPEFLCDMAKNLL